jgi:hypothetical protein
MQPKNRILPLVSLALLSLFCSCGIKWAQHKKKYVIPATDGKPDYANLYYWAAHPWKHDPSDSVPKPLRSIYQNDSLADVFFIHPTTFTDKDDSAENARLDDAALNAKTDYTAILYQASAFNQNTRVIAPRYRQMHLRLFFSGILQTTKPLDFAYADVEAAFKYYLAHYNHGRPIIIAAHSQGSIHANRLLRRFFEGQPLQRQLVCAYVIGMPMPLPDMLHTKLGPCPDSLATGCTAGWRTFKKGYREKKPKLMLHVTTNPLSWTQDSALAPTGLNTGGMLINFNKLRKGLTNARVNGVVLWTRKPRFFGNFLYPTKLYGHYIGYHIGDINLYYNNIRQNVAARIRSYYAANPKP